MYALDKYKMQKLAYLFFAMGVSVLVYILVHETGHLIVMLSAGAKIEEFSILYSHVSASGGHYTKGAKLWLNANGAVLPVLVSFGAMLFYNKKRTSSFYRIFCFMISLIPIGSLFAWLVIPFMYMKGKAPANDDVTKFLDIFSQDHSPLIVSGAALLIIAEGVYLSVSMGIIRGYIEEVRSIKNRPADEGEDGDKESSE